MDNFQTVKTMIDLQHSPWSGYTGQATGRVIHYLYHYLGINVADSVQVSSTYVKYRGKTIANIDWSHGFPHFSWVENELTFSQRQSAYQRQNAMIAAQETVQPLLEDLEKTLRCALGYAEKDTVFPHNKSYLLEIKNRYFKGN